MKNLYTSEGFTESDIQEIITNGLEESITLDFKSGDALQNNEKCKNEISKDISAFANSAGGVIIYGITEENHKAYGLKTFDGDAFSKEWLEQVIMSRINRRIEGVRIHAVRIAGEISDTVYVVQIPESTNTPHQCYDNKYYRRYNFLSVAMEEYEVRQLYFRQSKSKLQLEKITYNQFGNSTRPNYSDGSTNGKIYTVNYSVDFHIKNIGNVVEKYYKLEVWFPEMAFVRTSYQDDTFKDHKSRREGEYLVFAIPNSSPIFQNEIATIARAFIALNRNIFKNLTENPMIVNLYYTNDVDKREVCLIIYHRVKLLNCRAYF